MPASSKPAKKKFRLRLRWTIPISILLVLVIVLYVHNVPTQPTQEDRRYVSRFLAEYGIPRLKDNHTYADEIAFISSVQESILKHSAESLGIPQGHERELRDLYKARHGLCYDRSRSIEIILTVAGLEVRHVSIFKHSRGRSRLKTLMTPGSPSHAITEVKTSKGWLVVDSNTEWRSLNADLNPVSLETFQSNFSEFDWAQKDIEATTLLRENFIRVYGLYARHGRFYPPFNRIPDLAWGTIFDNIL